MLRNLATSCIAVTLAAGIAFAASPTTKPSATTKPATTQAAIKPYPLKTCMVSGEDLGDMGDPIVIAYEGREVKFCCGGCVAKFKKNPAKYIQKLEEADKKPTTKPTA